MLQDQIMTEDQLTSATSQIAEPEIEPEQQKKPTVELKITVKPTELTNTSTRLRKQRI